MNEEGVPPRSPHPGRAASRPTPPPEPCVQDLRPEGTYTVTAKTAPAAHCLQLLPLLTPDPSSDSSPALVPAMDECPSPQNALTLDRDTLIPSFLNFELSLGAGSLSCP